MTNNYICDECNEEYECGWSDEEAKQEMTENGFGDIPMSDMAIVCDSCYKDIMSRYEN